MDFLYCQLTLHHVFDLIKQIKIWRNENYFRDGFHQASTVWGDAYRQNLNLALFPRYIVEAFILLSASIIIFVSFSSGLTSASAIPNRMSTNSQKNQGTPG